MRRAILLLPLALILAVSGLTLPRFSAEYAVPCKQCHVNPNGGGMRNEFGNHAMAFSELCLPQTKPYFADKYRSPRLSDGVTIGFDSRYLVFDNLSLFRMQTDAFVNIEPIAGVAYQVRFWQDGVSENYALLQFDDQRHYVKIGRFYPAYGLRAADHTAFVRTVTGHTPTYYLDGLSLGTEIAGTQVVAELFDRGGQGIYGFHAYRPFHLDPLGLLLGGSLRLSEVDGNATESTPHARSLFAAVAYDRFTLMGEIDLVGKGNDSLAAYGSLSTRLEYGLYLIGEYNFLDRNRHVRDGVEEFVRISLEIFPIPFFELRPSYTRYSRGSLKNQDDFFLQVHVGY